MQLDSRHFTWMGPFFALWAGAQAVPVRQDEPAASQDEPAQVLKDADLAFLAATEERGLDGWLAWFAGDATLLREDGTAAAGPAAVRVHFEGQPGFPPPGFRWRPESAGLAASGDLGWTAGTYSLGAQVDVGRYLTVWSKQADGTWRVLTDLGGDVAFRSRMSGLEGPPDASAMEALAGRDSKSGELAIRTGTWTAERGERASHGRFLSVWRRSPEGLWSIVTEIGTTDS